MLNDFFLLQFLLTVTLLLFFYISENFFFILNAVTYLTAISALLWLHDLDIFVNFLVIIDLGVFFVLIAILVNVSSLFQNTYLFSLLNKLVFMLPFLFTLLSLIISKTNTGELLNPYAVFFSLNYYNWYSIFSFNYLTDLQLMSDIFYILTSLEFIVMNLYVYLTIVYLYILLNLIKVVFISGKAVNKSDSGSSHLFMRSQDIQKQINQVATVRVWNNKLGGITTPTS